MGITLSHTDYAAFPLVSGIVGIVSFGFTLATFFNVFWSSLITIKAAPGEMVDYLSNLKQGLIEERRHLRKVRKRMRGSGRRGSGSRSGYDEGGRSRSRGGTRGGGGGGSSGGGKRRGLGPGGQYTYFSRDEQAFRSRGEDESLRVMRTAIRDMIRSFRSLEYPFLKPEFQNTDSAHWSTNTPAEKSPHYNHNPPYSHSPSHSPYDSEDDSGLGKSNRFGSEYSPCGFRERWLWLRRKKDIISMSEGLSRIEVRRSAHEVGEVLMMVADIGKDLERVSEAVGALEGRMSRIVGVRRVD